MWVVDDLAPGGVPRLRLQVGSVFYDWVVPSSASEPEQIIDDLKQHALDALRRYGMARTLKGASMSKREEILDVLDRVRPVQNHSIR